MKQRSLLKRVSAVLMATALTISTFPQFSIPVFAEEKISVTEDSSEKDILPEDIPVDTKTTAYKQLKDDEINNNSLDTRQALDEITVTLGNLTITGNKNNYSYSDGNLTITGNGMFTLSGECSTITIQDSLEVNITASNLTIQSFNTDTMRIGSNTTLNLELVGDNTFSCERTPSDVYSRTIRGGTNSNLIIDAENGTSTLSIQGRSPCQDVNIQINGGNIQGAIDIVNDAKQPLYDVDWVLFNESEIRALTINGKPYNFNYTLNGKSVYLVEPENGYHDVVIKTNESTFTGRLYFNNRKFYYVEVEGDKTIFNGWEISGKHREDYTIDASTKTITFLNNGSYDINGRAIETNNVIRFKNGFSGTIQLHDVKSTSENEIISLGENTNLKILFNGENTLVTTWGDKATISTTHQSSSLTFDSNTNGILNVSSLENGVAIGSNSSTYNITFNGGIINAKGSEYKYTDIGAGVARIVGAEAKNIIVNGGVVNCLTSALGSSYGGNKFNTINAEIIINGGTVTAPYIGGSTSYSATSSVVINGGSVKVKENILGQLQNNQNKPISLLTVPIYEPVKEILVDGKNFNISSPHKDDNNLYLYITQENHTLTINGRKIEVVWQNDSKSFKLKNTWIENLSITGWSYGEEAKKPTAKAQFGEVIFTYSKEEKGPYTSEVPVNVGTWYVKATVAGTENYTGLEKVLKFNISKADTTLTFVDENIDKVYDSNAILKPNVNKNGSSKEITYTWYMKDGDNFKQLKNAPSDVGSYKVVVSVLEDSNYNGQSIEKTFTISIANNTWQEELKIENWTYGEKAKEPSAKAQFGNVSFTYSEEENGTYTSKVPVNARTYYVKASVEGTTNYTGLEAKVPFEIKKANSTIKFKDDLSLNKIYDTNAVVLTDEDVETTGSDGKVTIKWQEKVADEWKDLDAAPINVGTYRVVVELEGNDNYNPASANLDFVISQATNTWQEELKIENWTYGEKAKEPSALAQFGKVIFTYSKEENGTYTDVVPVNAGTYFVKATVTGTENYTGLEKVLKFNISKADTTLTFEDENIDKVYDQNAILNPNVNKNGSSNEITYTWYMKDGENFQQLENAPSDVGAYKVVVSVLEDSNYNGKSIEKTFAISIANNTWLKELKIEDWTYGDEPNKPSAKAQFGNVIFTYSEEKDGTYTDVVPVNVKTYYVKASVEGTKNYTDLEAIVSFEIAKASSTIKFKDNLSLDKAYDTKAVVLTDEDVETTGSDGKVTIKWQEKSMTTKSEWLDLDKAPSTVGTYRVVVELAGNDNYNPTSASLEFVISQATNTWLEELKIENWTYGDEAKEPSAKAQFGEVTYTYSEEKDGTYTNVVPNEAGTWYVKASVEGTENYTELEAIVSFEIAKAIPLYEEVTGLVLGQGQALSTIVLPENFKWVDDTMVGGKLGNHRFEAIYTPEDTDNYLTVNVEIEVEVVPVPEKLNHVPTIKADDQTITIGDKFDALKGVSATDYEDGELKVEVIKNTVNTSKVGEYEVTYKVVDSKGATVTKTIKVKVLEAIEDKEVLEDKIEEIINKDDYTQESYEEYLEALEKAKDVLNNPNASKEEIQEALANLEAAMNKLQKVENTITPETGDQTNIYLYTSMITLTSLFFVYLSLKKRKTNLSK